MPDTGPDVHPGDILFDCGCVLDFLSEALSRGRLGEGLTLSDSAAFGLCTIISDVTSAIREAHDKWDNAS